MIINGGRLGDGDNGITRVRIDLLPKQGANRNPLSPSENYPDFAVPLVFANRISNAVREKS